MSKLFSLLGLAGLHEEENDRAKLWCKVLEWPMMAAGMWLVALWYESVTGGQNIDHSHLELGLWSMFVIETGVMALVVDDRMRYLKNNWMNVVIILIGLPTYIGLSSVAGALRLMRILILLDLAIHMGSSIRSLLAQNSLGPTFAGSSIVIIMAGVMIAGLDPAINSPSEGIWWAWVTVTTVGYGDLVPVTNVGRFFAAILILIGLGLISLLTASMATLSMERAGANNKKLSDNEARARLETLQKQLDRLESKIDSLATSRPSDKRSFDD